MLCNSNMVGGIWDRLFVISTLSQDSSGKLPANIAEIASQARVGWLVATAWLDSSFYSLSATNIGQQRPFSLFCGWLRSLAGGYTSLILDAPYEKGIWSVNHGQRRRQFKGCFSWLGCLWLSPSSCYFYFKKASRAGY